MKQILNFVDGQWLKTDNTFTKTSPVDGRAIATVFEADQALVDRAVSAGKKAFSGQWGQMSLTQRCGYLSKIADIIERRADEFVAAESADVGVPEPIARMVNVGRTAYVFRMYADEAMRFFEQSYSFAPPNGGQALHYTLHRPKGVVGAISPWNVPLLLLAFKVAPALAAGNAVVAKPSEVTPQTATLLAEVIEEAGLPAGAFNLVHGFGKDSAGEYLTANPDVEAFSFTGDTRTGELIMTNAAQGIRDVCLELGGNNAALVFADCDLDQAVAGTLRSAFMNCGQICFSTERIYVHRSVYNEFIERLAKAVNAMKLGAPEEAGVQMGPLVSHQHREKVLALLATVERDGGSFVTGGGVPRFGDAKDEGAFIEPTVVTGLGEDAEFVRTEVFGPVCHVAPFDSEEEVVAKANDTRYGLAAVIWSQNLSLAHRVAAQVRAGNVWINDWQLRDMRTPMGGVGASGIGYQGGRESLEFFTDLVSVTARIS
ncbi:MAG: aldehyde dehydrogenase family protein [Amphritea sp.]